MIKEFYEGAEIFITGGSGVVGKALIEKILRSCNVKKIFLMLRGKNNASEQERLAKLCKDKIFTRLHAEKPDAYKKLIAVPGDALLPSLGITKEWQNELQNVSIVFHSAATIRFDEPLNEAIKLNVGGTLECLKFAETLQNLKMFMHVSTYYSHPYLNYMEPKIYRSPMDWQFCLNLANDDTMQQTLDFVTKKLIVGFPNTYTFTKNLAESLVNDYRHRLPLIICRPSIVLYALQEPEPGFPTSLVGAMGIFVVVGAGILKSVYLHPDCRLDFAPMDVCVKSMLFGVVKARQQYEQNNLPEEVPVILISSCGRMNHTFKQVSELLDRYEVWEQTSYMKTFLIPGCVYTKYYSLYIFLVFFKSFLPGLLADRLLMLFGKKPVILSVLRRAFVALRVMDPFRFNNYDSPGITYIDEFKNLPADFQIEGSLEVAKSDETLLASTIHMSYKIREHLLHESFDSLLLARRIAKVKKLVYQLIRVMLAYYLLCWLHRHVFQF